jgi:hypothetical protein
MLARTIAAGALALALGGCHVVEELWPPGGLKRPYHGPVSGSARRRAQTAATRATRTRPTACGGACEGE